MPFGLFSTLILRLFALPTTLLRLSFIFLHPPFLPNFFYFLLVPSLLRSSIFCLLLSLSFTLYFLIPSFPFSPILTAFVYLSPSLIFHLLFSSSSWPACVPVVLLLPSLIFVLSTAPHPSSLLSFRPAAPLFVASIFSSLALFVHFSLHIMKGGDGTSPCSFLKTRSHEIILPDRNGVRKTIAHYS